MVNVGGYEAIGGGAVYVYWNRGISGANTFIGLAGGVIIGGTVGIADGGSTTIGILSGVISWPFLLVFVGPTGFNGELFAGGVGALKNKLNSILFYSISY